MELVQVAMAERQKSEISGNWDKADAVSLRKEQLG